MRVDALELERYEAVLLDLDGTFYHASADGPKVLPGAVELVRKLASGGRKYACLTNAGASPRQLQQRLAGMGADIDADHIWSCTAAAAEYVLGKWGEGARLYNASTDGMDDLLTGKVRWVQSPAEPCDAVLLAAPGAKWTTQERYWTALQLLRSGRTALIGLCNDRVFPSERGMEFGSGSATAMMAFASGVRPVFCGKPDPLFFHELCRRLGVAAERCVLIGDNLESDIAGARGVGMASVLVLTGVASRAEAESAGPEKRPDAIIESLMELL
jgi:4-nitrophenyl phosphatase